jgi:hypothetical protein
MEASLMQNMQVTPPTSADDVCLLPKRWPRDQLADKQAFTQTLLSNSCTFLTAAGTTETVELDGVVLGLCFAYIPFDIESCKGMTSFFDFPKIHETYKKVKEAGHKFEVIFVFDPRGITDWSAVVGEDEVKAIAQKACEGMPWLAIPHGDSRDKELVRMFQKDGVIGQRAREIVILDTERNVVCDSGKYAMTEDTGIKQFPWHSEWVPDLEAGWTRYADLFNFKGCSLIVLCEAADEKTQESIAKALTPSAIQHFQDREDATKGGTKYQILNGARHCKLTVEVRALCKLHKLKRTSKPCMLLLELTCKRLKDEGVVYISPITEITEIAVKDFLEAHKSKSKTLPSPRKCDFPSYLATYNKIRNEEFGPDTKPVRVGGQSCCTLQ